MPDLTEPATTVPTIEPPLEHWAYRRQRHEILIARQLQDCGAQRERAYEVSGALFDSLEDRLNLDHVIGMTCVGAASDGGTARKFCVDIQLRLRSRDRRARYELHGRRD